MRTPLTPLLLAGLCAPVWNSTAIASNAPMRLADPTIAKFDETYYAYGTMGGGPNQTLRGFPVYTSTDLEKWSGPMGASQGLALTKGDAFGDTGFWAPQVFRYNGRFYMAYTANENIAIAVSDSPLGPFVNESKLALASPTKQIDPFVFFDDDGRIYLYHVRLGGGNTICVAEMNDDLMSIKEDTLKVCIRSEPGWENTGQYKAPPIAEGPTVIKHNGTYYLIYSANHFMSTDYAVGYAVSSSPLGPWKKTEDNPVIHGRMIRENGSGHGDLFQDKSGRFHYVLHTHSTLEDVRPRKTGLVAIEFVPADAGPDRLVIRPESYRVLQTAAK